MIKGTPNKSVVANLEGLSKSTFTLTFLIESVGLDVWHDCNEGWLDLGTCYQAMKIQYQLYPGQSFDVDILVWPHVVKIWCGVQYGWVRTWQFLERRWFAFSIRHAFPVRVADLRSYVATVTPAMGFGSLGSNAKNDRNLEIYLPALKFGEKRYFAGAIDSQQNDAAFLQDLIWKSVEKYIPSSYLDGYFDIPQVVSDVRHQDAVIDKVQETVLRRSISVEETIEPEEAYKPRERRESKHPKEKEKKKVAEAPKCKYEIKLSGDSLLAAVGRITQYETVGDRPNDQGEVIVLIGTSNLPAHDDLPIIFVSIERITDVPAIELKKARVTHLYTRWNIGGDIHESEKQQIKSKVNFNDHRTLLMDATSSRTTSYFLDGPFVIELRGTSLPSNRDEPLLYSRNRDTNPSESLDIPIATARIDASSLSKGNNAVIRGEFSLYPPLIDGGSLHREDICTNDTNGIGKSLKSASIIQPSIILEAQMTLEVSIGFVGCKPRDLNTSFSRLFCVVKDPDAVISIVHKITEINDEVLVESERGDLLTGFAIDVGDRVFLCVEGRRHGPLLRLWHLAQNLHSQSDALFSSSSSYASRLYPDMVTSPTPFVLLKMFAPLSLLLACPQTYVGPALPQPTRSALLKLGRLLSHSVSRMPRRSDLPTSEELKSFRLELCSPPRPGAGLFHVNLVPNASQTNRHEFLSRSYNKH